MSIFSLLLIALFLPLFPFSIGINFLLGKIQYPLLKSALLVFWPLIGLALVSKLALQPPTWVIGWAAFTSLLYAYRLLTERDINTWSGFFATSAWSLFWIPLVLTEVNTRTLMTYALGFGIPLTMILVLAHELKQRFGIAYTHLYNGLAKTMPRFSGILIMTVLATIATPIFPSFFIMLKMLIWATSMATPMIAILVLLIWLLWSWAGIRIIQGLLVGTADRQQKMTDLHIGLTWNFILILTMLAAAGLFITGDLS